MKKISREQQKRLGELIGELEMVEINLNHAAEEYRAKLVEAQEFCQSVADDIRSYMGDKSDTWQEGERGLAYDEWATGWENVELPEVDVPSESAAETLGTLDPEPSV